MVEEKLNAIPALELLVTAPNNIGTLTKITEIIKDSGINIYGIFGIESKTEGQSDLLIVTDNNPKTQKALSSEGFPCGENLVALVYLENKPGALFETSKKLSDAGINIKHVFATASLGNTAIAIMYTDNNKKTLEILNA